MSVPLQLFLSTIVGALIGLERESSSAEGNSADSGIRTYALVSLLGSLAGIFFSKQIIVAFLVLAVSVCALIISYYIVGSAVTKKPGMTTEISLVATFFVGFLLATNIISVQIILALLVVILLILSVKEKTKKFMIGVSRKETETFISYAVVALVILPFLPNTSIRLGDISFLSSILSSYHVSLGSFGALELLNPYKLWLVVVLVTGIDVFGYALARIFGHKKSFTLTSFVGGFISSTSTTQALATKSRSGFSVNTLVGAALVANLASFFQVFLLVGPLNPGLLAKLSPIIFGIIFVALVAAVFFLTKKELQLVSVAGAEEETKQDRKIFSLKSALQFALLLTAVKLATKICLILFGKSGFIISSVLASLAGLDAILINLAEMAGKTITFNMALLTFVLVNATNLASKVVYSFIQGSRKFAIKLSLSMLVVVVSSLVVYWII